MDNLARPRNGTFTSGLSVNEFLLTRDAGFVPVRRVTGTAVFRRGYGPMIPTRGELTEVTAGLNHYGRDASGGAELDALNQVIYAARDAAVARMTAQAHEADADGIIDVTFTMAAPPDWANDPDYPEPDVIEFTASGTAVRHRDSRSGDSPCRVPDGGLFTSGLSGQDCWALLRSGFHPARVAMGYCAYRAAITSTEYRGNREITGLTRAVYAAREAAMRRLQEEAARFPSAEGVVGFRFHTVPDFNLAGEAGQSIPGPQAVIFFATGTVITRIAGTPATGPPVPVLRFSPAVPRGPWSRRARGAAGLWLADGL